MSFMLHFIISLAASVAEICSLKVQNYMLGAYLHNLHVFTRGDILYIALVVLCKSTVDSSLLHFIALRWLLPFPRYARSKS